VTGQLRVEIFDLKLKKPENYTQNCGPIRPNPNPTRLDHVIGRTWANIFWPETQNDPTRIRPDRWSGPHLLNWALDDVQPSQETRHMHTPTVRLTISIIKYVWIINSAKLNHLVNHSLQLYTKPSFDLTFSIADPIIFVSENSVCVQMMRWVKVGYALGRFLILLASTEWREYRGNNRFLIWTTPQQICVIFPWELK